MQLPIYNLYPDTWHRPGGLTLQEAVCIANQQAGRQRSCEECISCGTDSDGGEPEYAQSWPVCNRFERYQYLKSFPFKRAPERCFQLDFFASPYAYVMDGWQEGWHRSQAFEIWCRSDRFGRYHGPLEPAVEQWEAEGGSVLIQEGAG